VYQYRTEFCYHIIKMKSETEWKVADKFDKSVILNLYFKFIYQEIDSSSNHLTRRLHRVFSLLIFLLLNIGCHMIDRNSDIALLVVYLAQNNAETDYIYSEIGNVVLSATTMTLSLMHYWQHMYHFMSLQSCIIHKTLFSSWFARGMRSCSVSKHGLLYHGHLKYTLVMLFFLSI